MSIINSILKTSLESSDNAAELGDVSGALIEMQTIAKDTTDLAEAHSRLSNAAIALEALHALGSNTEISQIATESIALTIGLESGDSKGVLAKIWQAIKSFFVNIWEKLKTFGRWLMSFVNNQNREINAIKEELKNAEAPISSNENYSLEENKGKLRIKAIIEMPDVFGTTPKRSTPVKSLKDIMDTFETLATWESSFQSVVNAKISSIGKMNALIKSDKNINDADVAKCIEHYEDEHTEILDAKHSVMLGNNLSLVRSAENTYVFMKHNPAVKGHIRLVYGKDYTANELIKMLSSVGNFNTATERLNKELQNATAEIDKAIAAIKKEADELNNAEKGAFARRYWQQEIRHVLHMLSSSTLSGHTAANASHVLLNAIRPSRT